MACERIVQRGTGQLFDQYQQQNVGQPDDRETKNASADLYRSVHVQFTKSVYKRLEGVFVGRSPSILSLSSCCDCGNS